MPIPFVARRPATTRWSGFGSGTTNNRGIHPVSKIERFLPLLEPKALRAEASAKAFAAGEKMAEIASVDDVVFEGTGVRGKVRDGNKTHAPRIGVDGRRKLDASCTCDAFVDGWEKVCAHAVALALSFRERYREGGDVATTTNPWVEGGVGAKSNRRLQIARRGEVWHVKVFTGGSAIERAARTGSTRPSPVDRMIDHYLDQEVDHTDADEYVLEEPQLAGLLYFAREAQVGWKGVGRLRFSPTPLTLRIEAEPRDDGAVELHALLEGAEGRRFEVGDGEIIAGAPTWYVHKETAEAFMVPHTPPWVLEAVAKQAKIVLPASIGAEAIDTLSDGLAQVGVPRRDLFALASDAKSPDTFVVTVEGDAHRVRVELAARYGHVSLPVAGEDPESARYTATIGDEVISFYRDLEAEAAARKALLDAGLTYRDDEGAFVAEADAAIEFVVAGLPLLPAEWEKRTPKLPKIRSSSPSARVSVSGRGGSVLDVHAEVVVDDEEGLISFRDLLRWLHEGRRWVELADGSVAKLDPKVLEPVAEAAGALQFDKDGHAQVSTLELGPLSQLLSAVPTAEVAKEVRKLLSAMTGEGRRRAPRKAKALNAKLRPYQRSGFAWLWQLHENKMTGILADDMGLGKTVQALALLTKAKEEEGPAPSLIVCPTSVLSVWKQEVEKWAPSLSVLVWHGTDRMENARLLKKSDLVVTSYALLRRDIDELSKIPFRYAILDEAQYIKNWTTSTAKAAKKLKAEHRLALTGTPVENHLLDLWAIFDFLAPGFLGKLGEFQKHYVRPIEEGDDRVVEQLRARVRPFIMRRKKEDVAQDLPKKTEQTLFVHFGKSQLGLYNRILKSVRDEIEGRIEEVGVERAQMTVLAALTRLRQVCCDPKLLGLPEGTPLPPSAKLEAFKELIADCVGSGRKVLVFSQFVEMQKILGQALDELDIEHLWLHGATKNRAELVERFQRKDGPPVFLISLKAGGSGLTLTEADTVIHYDPWWNPAVEDQATDRAHRIGQDKPVMVYRLVVEDTVEQKMVELGRRKREIAESALGRDATSGKKLTMEDIEELLRSPAAAPWDV
ncbi:MAG: helicase [Deltaproteobacteria bacterium]|nr:MAG: helicase [Deltaproteobacteria bacterium]